VLGRRQRVQWCCRTLSSVGGADGAGERRDVVGVGQAGWDQAAAADNVCDVTLTFDTAANLAADAAQAATFRDALEAERNHLLDTVVRRRALIDGRPGSGTSSDGVRRQAAEVRRAEAKVVHIETMLRRLERRFGAYWQATSYFDLKKSAR
jgi:hypothetical protein